jgi:hypothetical protein
MSIAFIFEVCSWTRRSFELEYSTFLERAHRFAEAASMKIQREVDMEKPGRGNCPKSYIS